MSPAPSTATGWGLLGCAGAALLAGLLQLWAGQAPPSTPTATAASGAHPAHGRVPAAGQLSPPLAPHQPHADTAPRDTAPPPPAAATARPGNPPTTQPTTPPTSAGTAPYKILGHAPAPEGQALVLFGQGRVILVAAPMVLDAEYTVEAVLDDHLLLRHGPSSQGLVLRPPSAARRPRPVSDPEDWPRD